MSEFIERILTVEDQRKLSKEWYGDENYSEHEVLENPETIKRNGREFTMMAISEEQGFTCQYLTTRPIALTEKCQTMKWTSYFRGIS